MKTVKPGVPLIPGATISMGGKDWVIPPLTLGILRRLMPKLRELTTVGAGMGEEQIDTLVEIITAAMTRNYPDITAETMEDLLDLGNAGMVLNAVLTGSGLKQGEATAASPTGVASTDSSRQPAATATP